MDLKLTQSFNKQINNEFYGAYLYFAMSTHFSQVAMDVFSNYMKHIARKKLYFAQQLYDYLILRNEQLNFQKISQPDINWIRVSDIFAKALSFEEHSFGSIIELYKTALNANDLGASKFICKYIQAQEKTISKLKKFNYQIQEVNEDVYKLA